MSNTNQLATIPNTIADVMDTKRGTIKKASVFLLGKAGLAPIKGETFKETKARVGAEKAKGILAIYNAAKLEFYVWSAKVDALSAADASMRKSVRIVTGSKGNVIGINTVKRFVAQSSEAVTLAAENAALKVRLAALEAAALPSA